MSTLERQDAVFSHNKHQKEIEAQEGRKFTGSSRKESQSEQNHGSRQPRKSRYQLERLNPE